MKAARAHSRALQRGMQNRERALLGEPPRGALVQGEPATDEEIEGEDLESQVQEDWEKVEDRSR